MGLRYAWAGICLALLTTINWAEADSQASQPDDCEAVAALTLERLRDAPTAETAANSRIAIIIDDLGYHLQRGKLAAALPGQVTLAVLPHSPFAARLAAIAEDQHKEVLLHLPMSSLSGQALDEGGLTELMDQITFLRILRDNLEAIPQARGLNNHMGSLLTQQVLHMQWLMTELRDRQLFFVDSRTTHLSIAYDTAQASGVPSVKRDFFLDNRRDCSEIGRQFEQMVAAARQRGHSLAIAHPYPETLSLLGGVLPGLSTLTVELVPVSALVGPAKAAPKPANNG